MKVNALDHVNIITADLDASACFYADVIGLERRDGPAPLTPQNCQWMHDGAGRAILHLNSEDCPRAFDRPTHPGPTGSVHHIRPELLGL
ncbi:VOC family protein [Novosphingobium aerophilum]|uniref:VOC family protein n=1 Tax=Novosphingobium aerophilum TaxID=2839843 RepID=UPI001F22A7D8|nr:VOC family protein [Novosphingobium aerophilum]